MGQRRGPPRSPTSTSASRSVPRSHACWSESAVTAPAAGTVPPHHLGLGQIEVVRRVPLARVDEGLLGGGPGDDLGPEAERGVQRALLGDPGEGGQPAVMAVVVQDVGAERGGLRYRQGEVGELGEDVRDGVEPGAAAGADDDLRQSFEPARLVEVHRQRRGRPAAARRARARGPPPGPRLRSPPRRRGRPGPRRGHRVRDRRALGLRTHPGAGPRRRRARRPRPPDGWSRAAPRPSARRRAPNRRNRRSGSPGRPPARTRSSAAPPRERVRSRGRSARFRTPVPRAPGGDRRA